MFSGLEPILVLTVAASTPILYAALGEIIVERSGVLNLGVEGSMLAGGLVGFAVAFLTGSPTLGFIAGIAAGGALALVHGFLAISLHADQVISGVMITLLGTGLTTYFGHGWVQENISGFSSEPVPIVGQYLVQIPLIGEALFRNTAPDFLALLLVPATWYFLTRTNIGLEIDAVGNDPATADTAGIKVARTRYLCVLLGGLFAGAGGATITLAFSQLWTSEIVAGRGWIAIALVIFAQWDPIKALFGAWFFGVIQAAQFYTQGTDVANSLPLSAELGSVYAIVFDPIIMSTYPYLATILVIVAVRYRQETAEQLGVPAALLKPYLRGSE